ncbi:MAG: hypothetical protein L0211_01615, partial [Planctomycetaceae bacterium]|nr:hypothetical protein [Planctomycetaceae bacterium]
PWLGLLTQTILRNPLAFTYADLAGLGTTEIANWALQIAKRGHVSSICILQWSIFNLQSVGPLAALGCPTTSI